MAEREPKRDDYGRERLSGLQRIAGAGDASTEDFILEQLRAVRFDNQEMEGMEREIKPEEKEIILGIIQRMPEFVKQWGGKSVPVELRHFHIVDRDSLKLGKNPDAGNYNLYDESINLFPAKDETKLSLAVTAVHELMHFNSFQSATHNNGWIDRRNVGSVVKTRDDELYFWDLNEAITSELTKRFDEAYFGQMPVLAGDLQDRKVWKDNLLGRVRESSPTAEQKIYMNEIARDASSVSRDETGVVGLVYTYEEERVHFQQLLEDIKEKYPKRFSDKGTEQVFAVFARAYFTGRMLDVAKLIDGTHGKKSFRELGETTKYKGK